MFNFSYKHLLLTKSELNEVKKINGKFDADFDYVI